VRVHRRDCRGFTLIELIASITIVAILAAIALPRMSAATPFSQRGYADAIAASLRQARAVALASGCAVRFTVDGAGYRAFQRAAAGTHCAAAGAWVTPVRRGDGENVAGATPAGVVFPLNRQVVFAADGTVGANVTINIGPQAIVVDASGMVQGP
jgi:MSHA pilin protein MshC